MTVEDLKSITFGAVRAEYTDGYYAPYRFSAAQTEFYNETNKDFHRKTFAGSGIRLDFYTDATSLYFECLMNTASSRPFCFTDVYTDGAMTGHFGEMKRDSPLTGTVETDLPGREARVTVYFPNLASMKIKNVRLENATYIRPYKPEMRLLCYGDSITQGYDAIYPSLSYVNLIGRYFGAETFNCAIGGEVFNAGVIDGKTGCKSPDLITVAYGTNDWGIKKSRDELVSAADEFFSKMTEAYPGVKIVYISPIWRDTQGSEPCRDTCVPYFRENVSLLEGVASKFENVILLPGMNLVPHLPEFFSDKYLHPTDEGFLIYASNLYKKLENILKETGK